LNSTGKHILEVTEGVSFYELFWSF